MNNVWIKTKLENKDKVILKCYTLNITILNSYEKDEELYLKIKQEDLKKINKIYFTKFKIVNYTGEKKILLVLKKYHIFFFALIIGMIIFYLITHIIISVQVVHSNEEIRNLLINALSERGIKKNTWKKNYEQLETIKNSILKQYPNKLEWLEINVEGMNYVVRVEERKIISQEKKNERCHIIAKKDGMIKKIVYSIGQSLVSVNDYVKKGDILISGIIKKDDETKNVMCATGKVYAEVWYEASVTLPKTTINSIPTNKIRYNFRIKNNYFNDFIFKSRLNKYQEEEKKLFGFLNTSFYFVKQIELTEEQITYSNEQLEQMALKQIEEKIKSSVEEGEIISQKILKQSDEQDVMKYQVFVTVLEQIGKTSPFELSND